MGACASVQNVQSVNNTDRHGQSQDGIEFKRVFSPSEVERLVDLNSLQPKSGLWNRETFRTGPNLRQLYNTRRYDSKDTGSKDTGGSFLGTTGGVLDQLTSKIHLLERQSRVDWKVCQVDQIHFYHSGSGMYIEMIDPYGMFFEDIRLGLGTNVGRVGSPQVMVPSGWFYRYRLADTDPFCLFGCVSVAKDGKPLSKLVSTSDLMTRCSKMGFDMVKTLIINCYDWTPEFRDSVIIRCARNPIRGKNTANKNKKKKKKKRLRSVYGSLNNRIAMWTESFSNLSLKSSGKECDGSEIPCVD